MSSASGPADGPSPDLAFRPTDLLAVALPFALHGLARQVDAAVGLLLHTSLDLPDFVRQALALLDPREVATAMLGWVAVGLLCWALAAALARYRGGQVWPVALRLARRGWLPLLLRPALTVLALASLAWNPLYPYGLTLPVALTQDWSPGQDLLAVAAVLACRLGPEGYTSDNRPDPAPARWRLGAPAAWEVAWIAFLGYVCLTPSWARDWEGHPGNEPKTLRMAVALGHGLTLDVEGVSAGMEELQPPPLGAAAARAVRTFVGESGRMFAALARGPEAVGRGAIKATRVTRQTIRGKEGGVFHVLAPGPSLMLAPLLRVDRELNRWGGTPGRLGVSVLAWNALAAGLVAAVFLLVRDATDRPGVAAALALVAGFLPPYLFYAYQFYPEMTGALAMAVALRSLLFVPRWSAAHVAGLSLLLAFLPWQHQKFLPVWGLLALMALLRLVDQMLPFRVLMWLVVPQLATLYLTALYNFAVTGSVRPDAMFLAWGPGGVSSQRIGQGLLGLLLDARYGLLPYVPLYLLAAAGLAVPGVPRRRLLWALPAVAVYYLTVASADNWSGAVCNLGRYVMPVTPWALALVGLAWVAAEGRRGAVTLALFLGGASLLLGVPLYLDPHAANDCALLLAKAGFADGNQYVPNLFIRQWADAAPGLALRVAAWALFGVGLALAWRGRAQSPLRAALGLATLVLATAVVLERWPTARTSARFEGAVEVERGVIAFLPGTPRGDWFELAPGRAELLVRSRRPLRELALSLEGEGVVRVPGAPATLLEGRARAFALPLDLLAELAGRRGVAEQLYRARFQVEADRALVLRLHRP